MERRPAIVLYDDHCGFCRSGASPPTPPRRSRCCGTADDRVAVAERFAPAGAAGSAGSGLRMLVP